MVNINMRKTEGTYPTKYELKDIESFESKTEEDLFELIKDLPIIATGHIYSDEECEHQVPSENFVFGGRFPVEANDSKLFGGLYTQIKSLLSNYNHVFCRSYPEIGYNEFLGVKEKYIYSRFIVATGDFK